MKSINKLIIKILSITCALTVVVSGGVKASAETVNLSFSKFVKVGNFKYGDQYCTNIGGIALSPNGSAQEMYVLKSHSAEKKSALYYYPNITNKSNYVIIRLYNIAGHANSMTIGSDNIFITCWQKEGSTKSDIVRINRSTIRSYYRSDKNQQEVTTFNRNSNGVTIIKVFKGTTEAKISSATKEYDKGIAAITKYGTNVSQYNTGKYFIVGIEQSKTTKTFAKAKLRTNSKGEPELVVLTDEYFTTNNENKDYTGQDFHYYPGKGFFVSYWCNETISNPNADKGVLKYGTKNKIFHYRFNHNTLFNESHLQLKNLYTINGDKSMYLKFEIESLTFNGNRLMLSVNAKKWASNNTSGTIEQKAKKDSLTGASDDQVILTSAL